MNKKTDRKVVLVTQRTRLDELVRRHNTVGQAQFYVEHHGGDFGDYLAEDNAYRSAVKCASAFLEQYGRLQIVDRSLISGFLFGENDLVVAVGRDGLVANTLKYLTVQKLIGVNPDPKRWDGVLLPFVPEDLPRIVPETDRGQRRVRSVTLAEARLNDGQTLCGVNDIFIGQRTHASARYRIEASGRAETQSSSGVIVSTGLGSTGWFKSVMTGVSGIDAACGVGGRMSGPVGFPWDSRYLYYLVREPYPSKSTGANLVYGKSDESHPIRITSAMPENGVIFSDGMEQDCLEFNSGAIVTIGVSGRIGNLVI